MTTMMIIVLALVLLKVIIRCTAFVLVRWVFITIISSVGW